MSEETPEQDGAPLKPGENPALQNESRQAVKNQGSVTPEDYPERHEQS